MASPIIMTIVLPGNFTITLRPYLILFAAAGLATPQAPPPPQDPPFVLAG